jgi:UDP-2,3-diacylglucosamine hydrolase
VAAPTIGQFTADPGWQAIDLLSDLHLHAGMPRTFEAWKRHLLGTPADAVLMLGDVFELWVGDDARFDGFEQQCVQVLREATARRVLAFMPGNRDFLVGDEMLQDCGVRRLEDPSLLAAWDHRLLLTHGDALCIDDVAYQRFRSEVRDPDFQRRFLQQPLAARQAQARAIREASARHQAGREPEQTADVDGAAAAHWLEVAGAGIMVHGHTHRPATHALPGGGLRHVLGDWDFDTAAPRASALRLTAAGLRLLDLAAE